MLSVASPAASLGAAIIPCCWLVVNPDSLSPGGYQSWSRRMWCRAGVQNVSHVLQCIRWAVSLLICVKQSQLFAIQDIWRLDAALWLPLCCCPLTTTGHPSLYCCEGHMWWASTGKPLVLALCWVSSQCGQSCCLLGGNHHSSLLNGDYLWLVTIERLSNWTREIWGRVGVQNLSLHILPWDNV